VDATRCPFAQVDKALPPVSGNSTRRRFVGTVGLDTVKIRTYVLCQEKEKEAELLGFDF
jgi:hypothetical protein